MGLDSGLILVGGIIAVALIFDFTNGFHDAANSISTIVSTRVLSPRKAVMFAAFFNFVAFLILGTGVAKTIGKGIIDVTVVTPYVILAGLLGAIIWNLITWYLGLPTSSSHALIGGYAGAAIFHAGFGALIVSGWYKIILFIFLAPLLGFFLGFLYSLCTAWVFHRRIPHEVNTLSRKMQIISSALYSLGHGGNDAQKTMGIIASLLFSMGYIQTFTIPFWVVLSAHAAIALGTLFGGWRIVKTMGLKITKLRPIDGFSAETGGATSLFLATYLGIPVSTTHTITGAISGVGASRRFSAVRWGVTLQIVWAWIFTIPAAGIAAMISYAVVRMFI